MHGEIIRGNFLAQQAPEWWLNFCRNGGSIQNGMVAQLVRTRCPTHPGIFTRSERSFEGDTGRFMMHIKEGPAYYDSRAVGVYRLTENGIWNSLAESKKRLISARMQLDYHAYYGSGPAFFVNRAYDAFQAYFREKEKELEVMKRQVPFMDEEERLMIEDVYQFCKEHERDLHREKSGLLKKAKRIYRILRS